MTADILIPAGYSLRDSTVPMKRVPEWAPGGRDPEEHRKGHVRLQTWTEEDDGGGRFRIVCVACRAVWKRSGPDRGFWWREDGLPDLEGGYIVQTGGVVRRCSCAWGQLRWAGLPEATADDVRTAIDVQTGRILRARGAEGRRAFGAVARELVAESRDRKRVLARPQHGPRNSIEAPRSPDPPSTGTTVSTRQGSEPTEDFF